MNFSTHTRDRRRGLGTSKCRPSDRPFDRKLRYVSGLSSLSLPPCLPLFRSLAPACFYYKRAPPAAQACNFFLFLRCCFRRSPSAVLSFGSLCLLSRAGGYRSPFLQGSPLLSPSRCALRKILLFSVTHDQPLELNILQFGIEVCCLELYFKTVLGCTKTIKLIIMISEIYWKL